VTSRGDSSLRQPSAWLLATSGALLYFWAPSLLAGQTPAGPGDVAAWVPLAVPPLLFLLLVVGVPRSSVLRRLAGVAVLLALHLGLGFATSVLYAAARLGPAPSPLEPAPWAFPAVPVIQLLAIPLVALPLRQFLMRPPGRGTARRPGAPVGVMATPTPLRRGRGWDDSAVHTVGGERLREGVTPPPLPPDWRIRREPTRPLPVEPSVAPAPTPPPEVPSPPTWPPRPSAAAPLGELAPETATPPRPPGPTPAALAALDVAPAQRAPTPGPSDSPVRAPGPPLSIDVDVLAIPSPAESVAARAGAAPPAEVITAPIAVWPPAEVITAPTAVPPPSDVITAPIALPPPSEVITAPIAVRPSAEVITARIAVPPPADVITAPIAVLPPEVIPPPAAVVLPAETTTPPAPAPAHPATEQIPVTKAEPPVPAASAGATVWAETDIPVEPVSFPEPAVLAPSATPTPPASTEWIARALAGVGPLAVDTKPLMGIVVYTACSPRLAEDAVVRAAFRFVSFLAESPGAEAVTQTTVRGAAGALVLTPLGPLGAGDPVLAAAIPQRGSLALLEILSLRVAAEYRASQLDAPSGARVFLSQPTWAPFRLGEAPVPPRVEGLTRLLTACGPLQPLCFKDRAEKLVLYLLVAPTVDARSIGRLAADLYRVMAIDGEPGGVGPYQSVVVRLGDQRVVVRPVAETPGRSTVLVAAGPASERPGLVQLQVERAAARLAGPTA